MSLELNELTIKRLNKVFISASKTPATKEEFGAIVGNLSRLGYWLNTDSVNVARRADVDTLLTILDAAINLKGDADYTPMYPNFPKQVAEAQNVELYINAIVHYIGDFIGERITPVYKIEDRDPLVEETKITSLGLATDNDLVELAESLMKQGQPFSENDINDLVLLQDWVTGTVETKIKENLISLTRLFPAFDWSTQYNTPTDVLRLAVSISGGDITLSTGTKFQLSRSNRRIVLSLLEKVFKNNPRSVEDFNYRPEVWKKLAKNLHAGESGKYPLTVKAFDSLYNGDYYNYNSEVELAILNEDLDKVLNLLVDRPGVFARRIAELLRKFPNDTEKIVEFFGKVSSKVSVPVLVQLWNYFNGANDVEAPKRLIHIKGDTPKTAIIDNKLSSSSDYSAVVNSIELGLLGRSGKKFYVKGDASQRAVPLNVRNASQSLELVGRGSRFKISDDKNFIRFFAHWRNLEKHPYNCRVDIDLAVIFLKDDLTNPKHISYYNLRDAELGTYHSGDLTSAPEGAAEFLDVNIDSALANDYRYALMTVYNYTGQPLNIIPEAWAGWMIREDINSGEIFEPSTVENKFSFSTDTVNNTPVVIDLLSREIIWIDSPIKANTQSFHNAINNENNLINVLKQAIHSKNMTVETLVNLLGETVDNENEADIIIDSTKIIDTLNLLNF